MRRKYENGYLSFKNQMPQVIICSVFFISIIIGSLYSNSLVSSIDNDVAEISSLVDGFIINMNQNGFYNHYLLGRSFLTYGKQVVLIWLFGLFSLTIPLIGLLVGIQGFSYGFTTSFLVMKYNLKGLILSLAAYGVQGTLFVCLIFILSLEATRFTKKDLESNPKRYLTFLIVGIFSAGILALYEFYIGPAVIQKVIAMFFN